MKAAYQRELGLASEALEQSNFDVAVAHFERAHILGQRYLFAHLHTHWMLFSIARVREDRREMMSQIVRLLAVVPGYLSGWVPRGNTGSGNVSALKPMAPPSDLIPILASDSVMRDIAVRIAVLGLIVSAYVATVMLAPPGALNVR